MVMCNMNATGAVWLAMLMSAQFCQGCARDAGPDAPLYDAQADTPDPDINTEDAARPDASTPDRAAPDKPTPDLPTPDLQTPDIPVPDIPVPDSLKPDAATPAPDAGTPDLALATDGPTCLTCSDDCYNYYLSCFSMCPMCGSNKAPCWDNCDWNYQACIKACPCAGGAPSTKPPWLPRRAMPCP